MTIWQFDPAAVRAAYRGAAHGFVATVAAVPADGWDRPALAPWTARDLAGHAGRALLTVEQYLRPDSRDPVEAADPVAYYTVLRSGYATAEQIAERARAAGAALGERPAEEVAAAAERVLALVEASSDDTRVATPAGVMRLADYLPSRVMELTVHAADLQEALGLARRLDPGAVAVSTVLAAGLAVDLGDEPAAELLAALTGRRGLPAGFSVV